MNHEFSSSKIACSGLLIITDTHRDTKKAYSKANLLGDLQPTIC